MCLEDVLTRSGYDNSVVLLLFQVRIFLCVYDIVRVQYEGRGALVVVRVRRSQKFSEDISECLLRRQNARQRVVTDEQTDLREHLLSSACHCSREWL